MTTRSLASTAVWLAAGRSLVAVVALLLPVVLARTLTRSDYGLYKQVELAAVLVLPFLLMGFDTSITYFVPRREREVADVISSPVAAFLGLASVLVGFALLAPEAFGRLLGTAPIRLLAAAAASYAAASAMQMLGGNTLVALKEGKAASLVAVVVGIPRTLCLVGVVLLSPTLAAILWVILAFALITIAVWIAVLTAKGYLRYAFDRGVLKGHLRYGGMLAVSSLINAWGVQLDNYLVASTLPPAMFAIYRVGRLRVPFLPILNKSIVDATAPAYSKYEFLSHYAKMATLWKQSVEILMPLGLLLSAFLASTAQWSIPLVYPHYEASVPIFRVFAFAILLESFGGIERVLRALAELRFLLFSTIAALIARIVLGLIVLDHAPLWVLTLMQLIVTIALVFARITLIRRRLDVPWPDLLPGEQIAKTLPAVMIGLVATWAVGRFLEASGWVSMIAAGSVWGALVVWRIWSQQPLKALIKNRWAFARAWVAGRRGP